MKPWEEALEQWAGKSRRERALAGAGGPGTLLVTGTVGAVVLKRGVPYREVYLYEAVGERLRGRGLSVPRLRASGRNPDWIVLEFLPEPLPQERWENDPEVLSYLARLHRQSPALLSGCLDPYKFSWDETALAALSTLVDGGLAGRVAGILRDNAALFSSLFSPVTWIHGDPNPTNWLLTHGGSVALTDWSRYGRAHPAVDIAIALPGLPYLEVLQHSAETYCILNGDLVGNPSDMARRVALAKLWSFLDFLLMAYRGELGSIAGPAVEMLRERLAQWVAAVFS